MSLWSITYRCQKCGTRYGAIWDDTVLGRPEEVSRCPLVSCRSPVREFVKQEQFTRLEEAMLRRHGAV